MNKTLCCLLEKEPVLHVDMLAALYEERAEIVHGEESCILLREKNSGLYLLSCDALFDKKQIDSWIKSRALVVVHDEASAAYFQENYGYELLETTRLCRYDGTTLPRCDTEAIRKLDTSYLPLIYQRYHYMEDEEYLYTILKEHGMYGFFIKEELVGFIGWHNDGAMGLLEVLPSYRRRGLARRLELFLIGETQKRGRLPFCQVVHDNEASLRLQQSLSLHIAPAAVYWIRKP